MEPKYACRHQAAEQDHFVRQPNVSSDWNIILSDSNIISSSKKIISATEKITIPALDFYRSPRNSITINKMSPVTHTSGLSATALPFVPGTAHHNIRADFKAESTTSSSSQLSALARPFTPGAPMHITRADSVGTSETAITNADPTVTDVEATKGAATDDDVATNGTASVTEDAATSRNDAATATTDAATAQPTDITCMAMSFDSFLPLNVNPKTMDQLFGHLNNKTTTTLPHDYAKKTSAAKILIKGPLALDALGSGNFWASRLSHREVQVFEAPLGRGPEVLTAVHYHPDSGQITNVSSLSVVQPPPGFKGHSARAVEETDSGRLIVYPIPRGKKRKSRTDPLQEATDARERKRVNLHRDRVVAMNAKLSRLDTSGAAQYNNKWFENPNRDPGSISSIWCETTMSDVDYFRSNIPVAPQSPAPAWLEDDDSIQAHDTSLDTSFPSNDSTYGVSHSNSSTAPTSQDTAKTPEPRPTPFHRRGISDQELHNMMPYHLYRSAVDLTEILQGKWPADEVQSHRDAGTKYAYVNGRDVHMLTLEAVEECEASQRHLAELKETQAPRPLSRRRVAPRSVAPSPPRVTQPASELEHDLSYEAILRLFGNTTIEDDDVSEDNMTSDDSNTTTDEEVMAGDGATHSPTTAPHSIPYHRRGKSDEDLSKMMNPSHCYLAKLLTRILRGEWFPEEVAYHRRVGTMFPYVHEDQVEWYDLNDIEDLEELQAKRPQPPLRDRITSGGPSPPLTPPAQAPSLAPPRTPVNQIHRFNLADYGYQPDWHAPTPPPTASSGHEPPSSSGTADEPFHMRDITRQQLSTIIPPHLTQDALLLKTVLQKHLYGDDPSAWDFYASCPAVVDQPFPYICGGELEMLTLREIGERERAQAALAWRAGRDARLAWRRREWIAKAGRRLEATRRRLALALAGRR
ncbi:hypothetical protein GE09DRAFT_1235929 [Coniochaeta sp. 2T2.1]|nr:hypothetical protein GE09DRAFT_1235929 [Coniochaeta sp. 2T2.1]